MEDQLVKAHVRATSTGLTTEVSAGKHTFNVDEPGQSGGKDSGPNPLQTVLGALAGCENIISQAIAKERGMQIHAAKFDISGVIDRRGLGGDPAVKPYFQKIEIRVVLDTPESTDRIAELRAEVERRCPVYTLIAAANVEIESTWEKA